MAKASEVPYLRQNWRIAALLLNVALSYALFVLFTGRWLITGGGESVWLFMALALWVLALLSAPWFRPPRDALACSITALGTLATLDLSSVANLQSELNELRWIGVTYAFVILAFAIAAAFVGEKGRSTTRGRIAFDVSSTLGRGEVLFGIPAMISIFGFYQDNATAQLVLVLVWVAFATVKPVELVLRTALRIASNITARPDAVPIGLVQRVDHPNIVRVALTGTSGWRDGQLFVACLPGGRTTYVLPLFTQTQDNELVGTGLCCGDASEELPDPDTPFVFVSSRTDQIAPLVRELSGGEEEADLVGFIVEGSTIGSVRFEVSRDLGLEEGMVVFCNLPGGRVFYQVLDALTSEESFRQNPRGTHIVIAAQLGTFDAERGFLKFPWLPPMNHPVFRLKADLREEIRLVDGEFVVGHVPSTNIGVKVDVGDLVEYHSAILGITGTGKTELALDLIRNAVKFGTKVFCVDFTGEYRARLDDLNPSKMGLSEQQGNDLEQKLFAVDTGEYGAKAEKRVLQEFIKGVRADVEKQVTAFLEGDEGSLSIFELAEVTNTKATLRMTELYLSAIMNWARQHRKARRILIVLEEAHTIIPETAGSGLDADSQWVVGRIGQIALQGRKFGVGLMVISQRTALVSKTILSQCNTYFTHALVDQTSLNYLASVYSHEHVRIIPNLRFLEFVAFGKAVRSERPMMIRRAYEAAKKAASDALNRPLQK